MKDFSKIFETIVNAINSQIVVTSSVVQGNSTIIYTCNTKWARNGKLLTAFDGFVGFNYTITNVVLNESITISTTASIANKTISVSSPFDITGTKMATNLEWTKASISLFEKTPIIWLLDDYEEKRYSAESSVERKVKCRIFFLDETDIVNYYTSDHKSQVIQPMIQLSEEFIRILNSKPIFKAIDVQDIKYFSRFGTESPQGFEKNILDANLSGLMIQIDIEKYKEYCTC